MQAQAEQQLVLRTCFWMAASAVVGGVMGLVVAEYGFGKTDDLVVGTVAAFGAVIGPVIYTIRALPQLMRQIGPRNG